MVFIFDKKSFLTILDCCLYFIVVSYNVVRFFYLSSILTMFRTYSHLIFREPETPETPLTKTPEPKTHKERLENFQNRIKTIKDRVEITKDKVVNNKLILLDYKISEAQKHLNRVDNTDGEDNTLQNLFK